MATMALLAMPAPIRLPAAAMVAVPITHPSLVLIPIMLITIKTSSITLKVHSCNRHNNKQSRIRWQKEELPGCALLCLPLKSRGGKMEARLNSDALRIEVPPLPQSHRLIIILLSSLGKMRIQAATQSSQYKTRTLPN